MFDSNGSNMVPSEEKEHKKEFISRIRPPSRANNISIDIEKLKKRSLDISRSIDQKSSNDNKLKRPFVSQKKDSNVTSESPISSKYKASSIKSLNKLLPQTKSNLEKVVTQPTTTRSPRKGSARLPLSSRFNRPRKSDVSINSPNTSRGSLSKNASPNFSDWIASPPSKKNKRADHDYKGRLEDNEKFTKLLHKEIISSSESIKHLNEKLSLSQVKISTLEESRCDLESKINTKEREIKEKEYKVVDLINSIESISRQNEDKIRSININHELELSSLNSRLGITSREKDTLESELRNMTRQYQDKLEENSKLSKTISDQSSNYLTLESENRHLKNVIEIANRDKEEKDNLISSLLNKIESKKSLISELETKIREEEGIRRQLHNTVQELKGNIRVFCRVRPPIGSEKQLSGVLSHLNFPEKDRDFKTIELKQSKESSLSKVTFKTHPFTFDRVFRPTSSQKEVFGEISQLVQSALDGYPVCIFAYGQTGSGKTFTMEGPETPDPDSEGMIPRAVAQIFEAAESLKEKGWCYSMVCQFVEIYNETLNDLLSNGENKRFEIRHDSAGKTTVTDVVTVPVKSPNAVHALLTKASSNRAVASTNCNERSSRSHSVFTMRLSGRNDLTSERSEGVLNLIDLAGSESLSKSGSAGDRLRETQAINRSLSCLSDVIHALSNQNAHIPYRNSKLTYLLQNSLGGNSKTLMFVNVSPLAENAQETLFSLQFATKVNSCQIGTAKKNIK